MDAFNLNCFELALQNNYFRHVIYTTGNTQLVLMSLLVGEEIGEEIHDVDQTLIFVSGKAESILDGKTSAVLPQQVIIVPAGTKHNFKNTGTTDLKLFTVYAPPHHRPGVIHKTKAEALMDTKDEY